MKTTITCEGAALNRALKDLASIAKGSDIAVLSGVLIEVEKGAVRFTTSNASQQITRTAAMDTTGKGWAIVDAARLSAIAGALESGAQAVMTIDAGTLIVKSGRSRYTFPIVNERDTFPIFLRADALVEIGLGDEFIRALNGVRHSISKSEVHWYMGGAMLHVRDGNLEVISSDNDRIAVRSLGAIEVPDTIIPMRAVELILSADNEKALKMSVGETLIWIDFGDTVIATKRIDAAVIGYAKFMDLQASINATLPRAAFLSALSRLMLVADDRDRGIVAKFGKDGVVLSNRSGTEEIPCDCDGELRLGFKAAPLREQLQTIDVGDFQMRMIDPTSPVTIVSPEAPGALMIAMPYRVAAEGVE